MKDTTPPATGSWVSLAVTVTERGSANELPTTPVWLLPPVIVTTNPWLWKAPMSTPPVRTTPR